jgi:high-affinity nickel-transport protein
MTGILAVIVLGFFLGMRHATDPDHVIAVTTIVSRHRTTKGAALIGAVWGLGHTLTILVVGGGIVLFSWVIPPRIGLSMEFAVGIMLILLGVATLRPIFQLIRWPGAARAAVLAADHSDTSPARGRAHSETGTEASHAHVHSHAHSHGDYVHTHPHTHNPEAHPHDPERTPVHWLDRKFAGVTVYRLLRPLFIGIVHGLAGSAAVALLVLTVIRNPTWGVLYLAIFGAGTIAGMMLITAAIALPLAYSDRLSSRFTTGLRLASGMISIAFGCWLAYEIGIVQGLFTGDPQWTPH